MSLPPVTMSTEISFHPNLETEFKNNFKFFNEIVIQEIKKAHPDLRSSTLDRVKRMTEYNVPGGKLNRGLMVLESFLEFKHNNFNSEDLIKASCLGWCIEWCQAFFLIIDDIMDDSLLRRGQACWFRQRDVGLLAINDALILKSSINLLLKSQFKSEIYYKFSELFNEIQLSTEIGQMLDMNVKNKESDDLMNFYKLITKYKTSLYSFYLPFACAFILANDNNSLDINFIKLEKEKEILLDIGHLFQVQDDVLDVFGDPEKTGKIGTDIDEGKCTWLLCKSLSLPQLPEIDRKILKSFSISAMEPEKIKAIYEKHKLLDHFKEFESESVAKIRNSITSLPRASSSRVLNKFLNKIIKRIK